MRTVVELKCDQCGRDFKREKTTVNKNSKMGYKGIFCSRKCFHAYLGKTLQRPRPNLRQFDHDKIIELRRQGYTLKEISEITGMKSLRHICVISKAARDERMTNDQRPNPNGK